MGNSISSNASNYLTESFPSCVCISRGIEHPGSLGAMTQLAQFLDVKRAKSDPECAEEAGKLYKTCYEGRREKLGVDHPSTHFSLYLLNRFNAKTDAFGDASLTATFGF